MKILNYTELVDQSEEIINSINKCFQEYLSDDIVKLNSQAREVEAWYSNVLYLLPQSEHYYRVEQQKALSELVKQSEKKPNEYDKEVYVNAKVAEFRTLRDTLKNLADSIKQRVSLAQTILKSATMNRSFNE